MHEFGQFGGQYVPDLLKKPLKELENAFKIALKDKDFLEKYDYYLKNFVGRPSPLYYAENMTKALGGGKIYLKREDLNHTGAHKINNAIGQILLAKNMGKTKVVAETGAGQHGVATATVAALFHMDCTIFMGAEDMKRQSLNVFRMELLGAKVVSVDTGTKTLSDAVDAAIEFWAHNCNDTFYLLGSAVGPHPYPTMVREFQRIIGKEAKAQILDMEGSLPNYVIAAVGGGSNAIGIFSEFIPYNEVNLIGVEAGGLGLSTDYHAATMAKGSIGILHGMKTYYLCDDNGTVKPAYSISAGLDYPGVGPEHSYLKDINRVSYKVINDSEAIAALIYLCKTEGIIPAIESSHAIAYGIKFIPSTPKDSIIIINLSGRGDKDMVSLHEYLNKQ